MPAGETAAASWSPCAPSPSRERRRSSSRRRSCCCRRSSARRSRWAGTPTDAARRPPAAPPGGLQAAIIGFAIRFRGIIVALALVLLGYGALSVMRAKYDVFPEFAPPQVGIQTEAPGLTAEQVEILVTQPIENAINGVPGVQSLRSSSIQGLSVITIIFRPDSDIYRDRQVVGERLAEAAQQLPANVAAPTMTPLTSSSSSTVLVLGLTSREALADGPAHARRLDAAAAAAGGAGRRQGRRLRRRRALDPGAGPPRSARSLQPLASTTCSRPRRRRPR